MPCTVGDRLAQQQRAEALLEFAQRAESASKQDLSKLREEIADRYLKRRGDRDKDTLAVFSGRIRYNSPSEAAQAYRDGKLSYEQLQIHTNYFRLISQQAKHYKPPAPATK